MSTEPVRSRTARRAAFYLLLLIVSLMLPVAASAHPHVFIDARVDLDFSPDRLTGVRLTWEFDEMFTQMILFDFDPDRDRKLSPAEIQGIEQGAFANLRNFGYFTWITLGGKRYSVAEVRDFTAWLSERGRLVYRFTVGLDVPLRTEPGTIGVAVFDDSYYVDISYAKDPAGVADRVPVDWSVARKPRPDQSYWGGLIVPEELVFSFRKK